MKDFKEFTLGQTKCYLVPIEDGYLMVDCGDRGDEHLLHSKLSRFGISLSSIKYLLITHHHRDNCGLLAYLQSQNESLQIIMSQNCAHYLETVHTQSVDEEQLAPAAHFKTFPLLHKIKIKFPKNLPPYQVRENDIIINNEEICLLPIRGRDLLVLATPGHTDDSISLIQNTNAFVGEAARNIVDTLGSSKEDNDQFNSIVYQESWRKLLALGIQVIHPSRGSSFPAKQLENLMITNSVTNLALPYDSTEKANSN